MFNTARCEPSRHLYESTKNTSHLFGGTGNNLENPQLELECYAGIFSAVAAARLMASLKRARVLDRIESSIPPPVIP